MSHISLQNLSKYYVERRDKVGRRSQYVNADNKVLAVNNVDLEFERGEMVCIIGPSGCGKSTLLRIIAGFDKPSSGRVLMNGKEVTGPNSDSIFVFQHDGLFPWMTVWENVELGMRFMENLEEKSERIKEYIEIVDLQGFENHYPHQLSGGMKRRAELARALAVMPDALIMDEPFTGLDFFTHMRMREEVVNMHEYIRKTILMVTHFIDDALIMADRIIVMSGRPSEVAMVRKLDFPRPRNLQTNSELNDLRDEIYLLLGVNYAV